MRKHPAIGLIVVVLLGFVALWVAATGLVLLGLY